jgi:hypothetical protein
VPDPIGLQHKLLPAGILPGDPRSSAATTGTSALTPKNPVVPPLVSAPVLHVPLGRPPLLQHARPRHRPPLRYAQHRCPFPRTRGTIVIACCVPVPRLHLTCAPCGADVPGRRHARPTAGLPTSPGSGARHHQRLHTPRTRGLCSGATRTVSSACTPITTSSAASQGCCCYPASDQPALDGDAR